MLKLMMCLVFIIFQAEASDPSTDELLVTETLKRLRSNIYVSTFNAIGSEVKTNHDPLEITFEIEQRFGKRNWTSLTCDDVHYKFQYTYTVHEGEEFKIIVKYESSINHVFCDKYNHTNYSNNTITVKADKTMGGLWTCTVLADRDIPYIYPVVQYEDHYYAKASCSMKIHVRQKKSPQTILVNNMLLHTYRTELLVDNFDFSAEYQYADGDVVNVSCNNFDYPAPLLMQYVLADTMSDESTMNDLISIHRIGFVVKLTSRHEHSYMMCKRTELNDYSKVLVRFEMLRKSNAISVTINGMNLRPKRKDIFNYLYEIEYEYQSYQLITVVCEVQRTDLILTVRDELDFVGDVSSFKKTELISTKKIEMSFYSERAEDKQLSCLSDFSDSRPQEKVNINFTPGNFIRDPYPLDMELPPNGTVMQLYSFDTKKFIFYEFDDGETLHLKCGPLVFPTNLGTIVYLQFKDSGKCRRNGCTVSETYHLRSGDDNSIISCYMKAAKNPPVLSDEDEILKEIRVILRERVVTTISTTTTPTVTALTTVITTTETAADPASDQSSSDTLVYCLSAVGGAILIISVSIIYWSAKKRYCCLRSSSRELPSVPTPRPDPNTVFYLNLLSVFRPINEREAAELENHYEEID